MEWVEVTGWSQMDVYCQPEVIAPRERLLAGLGLELSDADSS